MDPTVIVQNRPANESAARASMIGVGAEVPPNLLSLLVASTRGMWSSVVKYETMFALNPAAANLSKTSFGVERRQKLEQRYRPMNREYVFYQQI